MQPDHDPAHEPARQAEPSADDKRATENAGYNQRGHGKGGKLGEGEPDGKAERDGSTQPNFGQAGSWGKTPDPEP